MWPCHVTREGNFEKIYFFVILHLILGNVTKFLAGKLSTSEVISQKSHGRWKTPPPPVLLGLNKFQDITCAIRNVTLLDTKTETCIALLDTDHNAVYGTSSDPRTLSHPEVNYICKSEPNIFHNCSLSDRCDK